MTFIYYQFIIWVYLSRWCQLKLPKNPNNLSLRRVEQAFKISCAMYLCREMFIIWKSKGSFVNLISRFRKFISPLKHVQYQPAQFFIKSVIVMTYLIAMNIKHGVYGDTFQFDEYSYTYGILKLSLKSNVNHKLWIGEWSLTLDDRYWILLKGSV